MAAESIKTGSVMPTVTSRYNIISCSQAGNDTDQSFLDVFSHFCRYLDVSDQRLWFQDTLAGRKCGPKQEVDDRAERRCRRPARSACSGLGTGPALIGLESGPRLGAKEQRHISLFVFLFLSFN